MVSGLYSKVYEERLKELRLQTLEERRHQADMCIMHKIMHGLGGINLGHGLKKHVMVKGSVADPHGSAFKKSSWIRIRMDRCGSGSRR